MESVVSWSNLTEGNNSFKPFEEPGIMTVLYLKMFYAARKQLQKIQNQSEAITGRQTTSVLRKELKAAMTPCIILGVLLICWIPQVILASIYIINPGSCFSYRQFIADIFIQINSGLNPLIYAWRNKEFRHAFKKILMRIACRSHNQATFYG